MCGKLVCRFPYFFKNFSRPCTNPGYISTAKVTLCSRCTSQLTKPATAAVVVAMAGTILPAIFLVFSRSAGSILYMVARRFCKRNDCEDS